MYCGGMIEILLLLTRDYIFEFLGMKNIRENFKNNEDNR